MKNLAICQIGSNRMLYTNANGDNSLANATLKYISTGRVSCMSADHRACDIEFNTIKQGATNHSSNGDTRENIGENIGANILSNTPTMNCRTLGPNNAINCKALVRTAYLQHR